MSYRNDHDAALARIDALEAELGKNSDARERFTTLEQQLATAKAERDRARAALDNTGARRSMMIPVTLGVIALVVVGGLAMAIGAAAHRPATTVEPPAVVAAPSREERTAELMACVATLDAAVARNAAVSEPCRNAIGRQASDLTLGDDIHQILAAWYAAESSLASGRDAGRDALVERIHAYVIPSYTR